MKHSDVEAYLLTQKIKQNHIAQEKAFEEKRKIQTAQERFGEHMRQTHQWNYEFEALLPKTQTSMAVMDGLYHGLNVSTQKSILSFEEALYENKKKLNALECEEDALLKARQKALRQNKEDF